MAILNMERFGTEMAYFRFMLNSDISLITLFIIYYNVTKKHRGNGGRLRWKWRPDWEQNRAGMKDTGPALCRWEAVWNLTSLPQAMYGVFPLVQCHGGVLQRQNQTLQSQSLRRC